VTDSVEEFDHPFVVVGVVQRQRSAVPSAAWSREGLNVPVPDVAGSTAGSAHHAHGGRYRASHSLPPPVQSVHTAARGSAGAWQASLAQTAPSPT